MGIDIKDIVSRLHLDDSQKRAIAQMASGKEIQSFLERSGVKVPKDIQASLVGMAGKAAETTAKVGSDAASMSRGVAKAATRNAGRAAGTAQNGARQVQQTIQGVLDSTDIDEKLMGGAVDLAKKAGGLFGGKKQ